MMAHSRQQLELFRSLRWFLAAGLAVTACAGLPCAAQPLPTSTAALDEIPSTNDMLRDTSFQRLLRALERQPRPGTTLDRILTLLHENAALEPFTNRLRSQLQEPSPNDTSTAAILGLLELEAGRHAAALAAFTTAEKQRPNDPVIPWLLASAALQTGDATAAVAACERSLALKPAPTDLPNIARDFTLALRKAGQAQRIPEVWAGIEDADPDNLRLCSQAAAALRSAGLPELALLRYQRLAESLTDPYRRTQARLAAADLKRELGRADEALRDDQMLLDELDPQDWQTRQLLDRIETAFLQASQPAELLTLFQKRLERSGPDPDLVRRITRLLRNQSRTDEAIPLLLQLTAAAPADRSLRLLLIEELARSGKTAAADAQYSLLEQTGQLRPEDREAWGFLFLTQPGQTADNARKAAAIWLGILTSNPTPSDTTAPTAAALRRVADLLRGAGLADDALPLYQQALRQEPDNALTRERLGSCLHSLGRREDALSVWQELATGTRRSPEACRELSTILQTHGEHRAAIDALQQACETLPRTADLLRLATAMLEFQDGTARPLAADALPLFTQAAAAAETFSEWRQAVEQHAAALQQLQQLPAALAELRQHLAQPPQNAPQLQPRMLLQLALFERTAGNPDAALSAARTALSAAPNNPEPLQLTAELSAAAGLPGEALTLIEKLLVLDPRGRLSHLQSLMALARQQGLRSRAADFAEELLRTAADDPEVLTEAAEVLAECGRSAAAATALEAAVRRQPEAAATALALASLLTELGRHDRAADICRTALLHTLDESRRTALARLLAELLPHTANQTELFEWLEAQAAEAEDLQRGSWLRTIADVHSAAGQHTAARTALERCLEIDGPSPTVLLELADLNLLLQDSIAAVNALRQIKPDALEPAQAQRLLDLALRSDSAGTAVLLAAAAQPRLTPADHIALLDRLLQRQNFELAQQTATQLLAANPGSWEIQIRLATALSRHGQTAAAAAEFNRLLAQSWPLTSTSADTVTSRPGRRQLIVPARLKTASPEAWETAWEHSVRILLDLSQKRDPADFSAGWCGDFSAARLLAIAGLMLHEHQPPGPASPHSTWDNWVRKSLWSAAHGLPRWCINDALLLTETDIPHAHTAALGTAVLLFAPEGAEPATDDTGRWLGIRWQMATEYRSHRVRRFDERQLQGLLEAYRRAAAVGDFEVCHWSARAVAAACAHAGQPAAAGELARQLLHEQASGSELLAALALLDAAAAFQPPAEHSPRPLAEQLAVVARVSNAGPTNVRQHALKLVREWIRDLPSDSSTDWHLICHWWLQQSPVAEQSQQSENAGAASASEVAFTPRCWLLLGELLPPDNLPLLQELVRRAPDTINLPTSTDKGRTAVLQAALALQTGNLALLTATADLLAEAAPKHPAATFLAAECRQRVGRFDEALAILRSLPPGSPQQTRRRALRTLELACLNADTAAAEQAAGELAGLELSAAEFDLLLSRLRTVGLTTLLNELQQRLLTPVDAEMPSTTLSPATTLEQLQQYRQTGNTTAAVELARQVVNNNPGRGQNSGRFRRRQNDSAEQLHKQALEVLAESQTPPPTAATANQPPATPTMPPELQQPPSDSPRTVPHVAQRLGSTVPEPVLAELRASQLAGDTDWLGEDWPDCGPQPLRVIQRRLQKAAQTLAAGTPEACLQQLLMIREQDAVQAAAAQAARVPAASPVSLSALRQRTVAEITPSAIQRAVAARLEGDRTNSDPPLPWSAAAAWFEPSSRETLSPGSAFLRTIASGAGRGDVDLIQLRENLRKLQQHTPADPLLTAAVAITLIQRTEPADRPPVATEFLEQLNSIASHPTCLLASDPDQLLQAAMELALLLDSHQLPNHANNFREFALRIAPQTTPTLRSAFLHSELNRHIANNNPAAAEDLLKQLP
jgi:predicted Zn-dependent protease